MGTPLWTISVVTMVPDVGNHPFLRRTRSLADLPLIDMAMSERRQVWFDHWLSRVAIGMIGPGVGFLIVVAWQNPRLETGLSRVFGALGLAELVVGLSLLAVSWTKTR